MAERVIENMSAEERQEALRDVAGQMVARMSPAERLEAAREVLGMLVDGLPAAERAALVGRLTEAGPGDDAPRGGAAAAG
jgi:hypothetical protein